MTETKENNKSLNLNKLINDLDGTIYFLLDNYMVASEKVKMVTCADFLAEEGVDCDVMHEFNFKEYKNYEKFKSDLKEYLFIENDVTDIIFSNVYYRIMMDNSLFTYIMKNKDEIINKLKLKKETE